MNAPVHPQSPSSAVALDAHEHATVGFGLSEKGIVAVTALGHFICHLSELVYPAVILAVMAEFSLSPTVATSLAVLGWILLGAGAIPVGLWADAWGPMRVLRWYFLLTVAAALLVAVTPNVWFLFFSLTLLGLTASIYHPVGLAMLSLGVKARGRAMGLNGIAGQVGIALGPALGMAFCVTGWWRMAYVVVAALALVSFFVFWWLTRHVVLPAKPQATEAKPQAAAACGLASETQTQPPTTWRRYLPLILLYTAMLFGGFNYRYLMTALPTYITGKKAAADVRRDHDAPTESSPSKVTPRHAYPIDMASAFIVLLPLLVGGVGQYAGGWLSDRFGARFVYPTLICMVIPMALVVGLSGGGTWALLPACILAGCMFGQQPVENSVLAERTSRGRRGLSYAAKFTLAFGVGALGAAVAGVVWEYISLSAVFYFLAGGAIVMAILATSAMLLTAPVKDKSL